MSGYSLPPDEEQRLRALESYGILDSPPEVAFERITGLASRLLRVPIALVSLVDAERQWFKSACGLSVREMPRAISFCTHAILHDGVFIVPDATRDPRFADNPLVTGPIGIRFYAGAPLRTPDGEHRLGTLCVIDTEPRELDEAEQQTLRDLAEVVVDELKLRRETRLRLRAEAELAREQGRRYRQLVEQASDAFYISDVEGRLVDVNQAACDLTGYSREELLSKHVDDFQVGHDAAESQARRASLAPGRPVTIRATCRRKDGSTFPVEARVSVLQGDGEDLGEGGGSKRFFALMHDVTEQQRTEDVLREANERLEQRVAERTAALARAVAEMSATMEEKNRLAVAVNSVSLGVIIVDGQAPDHPIVFANPAFSRITGYSQSEIIGRNCRFLQGPETNLEEMDRVRGAIRAGQPFRGTLLNYRKDGTPFWNEVTISPVEHGTDGPRYFIGIQVDETARRRTEERLRLLESVVVNAHDGILITGVEIVRGEDYAPIVYANRAMLDATGYTLDEILGRSPAIFQGPGTSEEAKANLRRAVQNWQPVRQELIKLRKDGSEFWAELTIVPVANEHGRFTHWVSVQRDVTKRKAAETALLRSEGRLRQLFDTNPLPTWVYDLETLRFLEVNPAAVARYGYTRAEFLGMTLRDIRPPEDVPALEASIGEPEAPPGEGPRTWRHVSKDGNTLLVEIASGELLYGGRPARVVVVRDVTEKQRTERALRESQARYERITANMPGMVYQFVLRADGSMHFPFVSEGCQEIYGLEPEDVQRDANLIMDLMAPGDRAEFMASCAETAATLKPWRWEGVIHAHPDGRLKHIQAIARPERMENGDVVWDGVILDVTERKRTQALQVAKDAAERANAAKSEFLSRMSHELRTPLNAILGFGQLLELADLDDKHQQSVEHILRGGRHLLALIDEVLDIARIESGYLALLSEPIEIGTLVRETIGLVQPLAAGRGVQLRVFAADDLPLEGAGSCHVQGDPGRLKQILLNLLSNAVKYNRPNGEVEVRCVEVPGPAGEPGRVRVMVRDTGAGLTTEQLARLFVPFERLNATHGSVEGTGLGLAVSRRLAEAMGGTLEVASTPGLGSTFWVELPRTPEHVHAAPPALAPAAAPAPPPTSRRLLYIEDHVSNFRLVQRILAHQRPDWQLIAAADGATGLSLARSSPPDLILLDRQLPGLSGDEVLERLQADPGTRMIPVVLLSADANPVSRDRLLAAGARAYLTKPLEIRSFLAAVDEVLAGPGSGV